MATCIASFKVLRLLLERYMTVFSYQDPTFPKDASGAPDTEISRRIRTTISILEDAYKGAGKLEHTGTFRSRMQDVSVLLLLEEPSKLFRQFQEGLNEYFADLYAFFGPEGTTNMSSSNPRRTLSNRTVNGNIKFVFNLYRVFLFFRLQISNTWYRVTTTLTATIVLDGKSRISVVQNLQSAEYQTAFSLFR